MMILAAIRTALAIIGGGVVLLAGVLCVWAIVLAIRDAWEDRDLEE